MPSYDPVRARLLSEIGRWIPRSWKGRLKCNEVLTTLGSATNSNTVLQRGNDGPSKTGGRLRLASLLDSVKDFTTKGKLVEAFTVFEVIRVHALSSSCSSPCDVLMLPISALIEGCADDSRFLFLGRQLHGIAVGLGVDRRPYLVRKLVFFYCAFNLVFDAHFVAESCNSMNPLRWNVVIANYVKNGLYSEALSVYTNMVGSRIRPDNFTFPSVLKACGEQLNLSFGGEIHKTIAASNCKPSVYVQNALISMYGKCGEVAVARELFENLKERDAVSWNSIVTVYASKGMWDEANHMFDRMLSEVSNVSHLVLNTMAGGFLQMGKFVKALEFLSTLRKSDIRMDDVGMVIGLTACSHVQYVMLGQQFHASALCSGCDGYLNVKNALITMYSRCNNLKDAYIIFQLMKNRSLVTWNAIISGYSYWDGLDEASFLFREMLLSGFEPNYVTIASILPLCGRVANLQHGRQFHCYILRRGQLNGYLLLWNSIIDMYARSGKIINAKRVFNSLGQKDEVSYTSLISGYGAHGQGGVALELFREMRHFGIKPDHITLLAVLSACSHTGLVNEGQMLFDKMESGFGIKPGVEHFTCMVDLFGRAGLLWKAAEFIGNIRNPTPEMWVTLIGACHIHGNMKLGEWAAESLLEMRPENSGYYVLIANMYATAGFWDKIATVRTLMKDLGVRNTPGHAWVDLGTGFQPFCAGDSTAEVVGAIYLLLDGMNEHMKDALHGAAEVLFMEDETMKVHTVSDEDSEDVKIWHSMV